MSQPLPCGLHEPSTSCTDWPLLHLTMLVGLDEAVWRQMFFRSFLSYVPLPRSFCSQLNNAHFDGDDFVSKMCWDVSFIIEALAKPLAFARSGGCVSRVIYFDGNNMTTCYMDLSI